MRILLALIIISSAAFAQEFERWGKKEIPYAAKYETAETETGGVLNAIRGAYRLLLSDLDGDNCPFAPTCSSFFTKAAAEYGLITGGLMFADRFTRDMNLFKGSKYPRASGGRLYDPPGLYIYNRASVLNVLRNTAADE